MNRDGVILRLDEEADGMGVHGALTRENTADLFEDRSSHISEIIDVVDLVRNTLRLS